MMSGMDDRNLGPDIEAFMESLVESGRYPSRDHVLREGVRLVRHREAGLARFDAEIMKGIEDVETGRTIPVDEAFDRLDAYIEELARKKKSKDRKKAA